jgi:hypothetical protein
VLFLSSSRKIPGYRVNYTTAASLQIRFNLLYTTHYTIRRYLVRDFIIIIIPIGVRLSPLGTAATTGPFYQPKMIDDGDCGAVSGMKIGRGNLSSLRKSTTNPT